MPTSRTDQEAGFTLIELLAVLAITALAAVAVLRLGQGSGETARVRAFLVEAEALMRTARTAAILSGAPRDVLVDAGGRRLTLSPGGTSVAVPQGLALAARLGAVEGAAGPAIRFYPAGGASGGEISFRFRGQDYGLRVDWLTGRADAVRG